MLLAYASIWNVVVVPATKWLSHVEGPMGDPDLSATVPGAADSPFKEDYADCDDRADAGRNPRIAVDRFENVSRSNQNSSKY